MITDRMTYQEIAEAVRNDWSNELRNCYINCFGQRKAFGKIMLKDMKPDVFHFLGRREKLTKAKNKYVFLFYSQGKAQFKHEGPLRSFRLEYLRKDGLHAVKINVFNTQEVTFYTPHFFDRYRERFLEKEYIIDGWTKEDVMDDFFMNNVGEICQSQNNPKYPDGIFLTTDSGVILGVDLGDGLWEYRTFVTFDMLKGNQIEDSNEEAALLEQIRDLPKNIDINSLIKGLV